MTLALLLAQTLTVSAEAAEAGLAVRGETDLPDGAIVTAWVYYETVNLGCHLASRSVRVADGRFETSGEAPFPGSYVVCVTVPLARQPRAVQALLEGKEAPQARTEVRVGSAEDESAARREHWDALGSVFRRFDALAAALADGSAPADWRERFDEATAAFEERPSKRILGPENLEHGLFGPMRARLGALSSDPAKLDEIRSWAARLESRLVASDAMTPEAAERARALLDMMADGVTPAALMELASLLPPGAQVDVQALATATDRGDILARLREWTKR